MMKMDQIPGWTGPQALAANQAIQVMNACMGAVIEATTTFTRMNAERSAALASAMMSPTAPQAIAEINAAFVRDSMQVSSAMAQKISEAWFHAAKQTGQMATEAMEAAKGTMGG